MDRCDVVNARSFVLLIACATLFPLAARADEKTACVAASTDGQSRRDEGKLTEAHDLFVACSRDQCPRIVRRYCTQWLSEVDKRMASVAVRAVDENGAELNDFHVLVDGKVASVSEGKAISLDPGAHVFRFERDGSSAIEQNVQIAEGEKGRVISATFITVPAPAEPAPTPSAAPTPSPSAETASNPIPAGAWIAAAVGIAGLGSFAYMGLTATGDLNSLRSSGCAPHCNPSDVDAVRSKMLIADASLGVGIAGIGTAALVYFLSRKSPPATKARIDVHPVAGGGIAEVGGRF